MGLTSRQIVEARRLLRWHPGQLAVRAGLSTAMVMLAEVGEDDPPIPADCAVQIWQALECAGIHLVQDDGEVGSVRLRQANVVR